MGYLPGMFVFTLRCFSLTWKEFHMKRMLFAALMAAVAIGCAPSSVEPVSDNSDAPDLTVSVPDVAETDGGQTPDATADASLTLVTLKVPGMT